MQEYMISGIGDSKHDPALDFNFFYINRKKNK